MAEKKDAISKRARNREIERKKRQYKLMYRYGFYALAILLFLGVGWLSADAWSRRWILNVDGNRISTREFRFLTYFFGDKDFAMEMLQRGLVLEQQAERYGLSITDDERQDTREFAQVIRDHYRQQFGISLNFISLNRKTDVLSRDWFTEHLREHLLPETDFYAEANEIVAADFAHHLEHNRLDFIFSNVRYILANDRTNAESALTRLAAGEDFVTLIRDYDDDEQGEQPEDHVFDSTSLWQFAHDFDLSHDIVNTILDIEEGQVSEIIELGGNWFLIVYVESKFELDPEMVEENFMQGGFLLEETIWNLRSAAFDELVEGWMAGFNPIINQRAFDRV